MEDKAPSKIYRTLQILIPLTSVAVAIIAVLLSVASRKKEITCTLLNTTRLVSENLGGISPDMHVEFRGQPIYSLSKMTFSLRNTGAAAIRSQDISDALRLQFPPGSRLLSCAVERTQPKFAFSARETSETSQVVLDFPLLNSGDEAVFSVYILNSDPQSPTFDGRVVDVPQLVYVESQLAIGPGDDWPHWSHATRTVVRRSLIFLYGFSAAMATGFWLYEVLSKLRFARWKPKWSKPYSEIEQEVDAQRKAEEKLRFDRVLAETAKMSRPEAEAHMKASINYSAGYLITKKALADELKRKGIPARPDPMTDTFGDFLSFSLLILGISCVTGITAVVIHTALRG